MNENTIAGRNLLNDPELFGGKFHCLFNIVQSIVWRWLMYRIAIGIRSGERHLHWDWSDSMNENAITGRNLLNDPELFGGKFHCVFDNVVSNVWRWIVYRIAIGIRSREWSLHWFRATTRTKMQLLDEIY